jgi:hypothetical protein
MLFYLREGAGSVSLIAKRCCIVSILFGLYKMMICNLKYLPLRHLVTMYMTVCLMVIDTQGMCAARKYTFPVISRGL